MHQHLRRVIRCVGEMSPSGGSAGLARRHLNTSYKASTVLRQCFLTRGQQKESRARTDIRQRNTSLTIFPHSWFCQRMIVSSRLTTRLRHALSVSGERVVWLECGHLSMPKEKTIRLQFQAVAHDVTDRRITRCAGTHVFTCPYG